MQTPSEIVVNPENRWRLETPGNAGWARSPRPGAARKYFMVSADSHAVEPMDLWAARIDKKFAARLPRIEERDGSRWLVREGTIPLRINDPRVEGEDAYRQKPPTAVSDRLVDMDRDGIDHEVMFPNRGLLMYASLDAEFAQAQITIYNDWVWETYGKADPARFNPAAMIYTGELALALDEIARAAKLGFRTINLPCKPIFGAREPGQPNYNQDLFDPMWALIEETGLATTFHVSTGSDPRTARGNGGAVVNYAVHAMTPTSEPIANICASGVLDRFPKLRFATIEAGIGWIPWFIRSMDEAYLKHHFWVRPKLKHGLPSDYYKAHFTASFQEDPAGLALCEPEGLQDNFMWASDYPHNEGTFPHSAEAIERQMGRLSEQTRAQVLGLNAAKFFNVDVPEHFRT